MTAIRPPLSAPRAVASIAFSDSSSRTERTSASTTDSSVSGMIMRAK